MKLMALLCSAAPVLIWSGIRLENSGLHNLGTLLGTAGVIFTGIGIGVLFREVADLKEKTKRLGENGGERAI